jgi:hypothetical protein
MNDEAVTPVDPRSLTWRADGYLVWAQAGDQPANTDMKVATFTHPDLALHVVRHHNAALAGL